MVFYRGDGPRDLVIGEVGNLDGRILASEGEEAIGEFSNWMAGAPQATHGAGCDLVVGWRP